MAGLKDLTDEILVEIIQCLVSDKSTLHRLAIVNEKCNELVIRILAHEVDICVQPQDKGKRPLTLKFYASVAKDSKSIMRPLELYH